MRQTDRMGRGLDGGGMEGTMLAGAGTGASPLSLEGRREAVDGTNCVGAARARGICFREAK